MPNPRKKQITRALAIPGVRPIYPNVEGTTVSFSEFIEDSREINSIFDQMENPRLSFFDPSTKICKSGVCESNVNGTNYYSDTYHISLAGAMSFRDDVESLVN